MSESEVGISAITMVRAHGRKAVMEADKMADKMRARQDDTGHENWTRIATAIRMLDRGHDAR